MKQLGIRPRDNWYLLGPGWNKRGRHRDLFDPVAALVQIEDDREADWCDRLEMDCSHRDTWFCNCWDWHGLDDEWEAFFASAAQTEN